MTKMLTNIIRFGALMLAMVVSAQGLMAQGNQDDNFLFGFTSSDGSSQVYRQEDCGFGYSQFGASVQDELCADIMWAYDITPDSICCDTITMDLTGKFALIRRGACNFSIKAYYAQQAGAIGCIIVNHYDNADDNGCSIIGMAPGTFADDITIPCIFLCRDAAEAIDAELQAGNTVEGCFLLPRVTDGWAALSYATPVSQLDTMYAMGVNFINRSADTIQNLSLKADISGPNGYSFSYSTVQDPIAPAEERLLFMDGYVPNTDLGKYTVTLSNDFYTESRDSITRNFAVTDYVFGNDNLELMLDGGADRNDLFLQGYLIYQTGSLYWTGADGGTAQFIEFGIANIDSVYTGDDESDTVFCLLYDGDADGDGSINLTADFSDVAADLVASGQYIMDGTETEDNLLCATLDDFFDPGNLPVLSAFHPYYVSLLYDGNLAGSGRNCAFSNSSHEDYLIVGGGGATPMFLGQFYNGGWSDRTVVQRLLLEGATCPTVSTQVQLDPSKISITPNPGSEYVNLNLSLESTSDRVVASIFNGMGQVVKQEIVKNFQNGTIRFDVNNLPTGNYIMTVNTGEGYAVRNVVVCH
ncbi:MAG: PA domain-containing protein [Saprospiraceae bacterium]